MNPTIASMLTPSMSNLRSRIKQLRSENHEVAEFLSDQLSILDRLDALIARPLRDFEPLDGLEEQVRPRERMAIYSNLIDELAAIDRWKAIEGLGSTINVRDLGAIGDGRSDDGPVLRKAIEMARIAGPGTTVEIPDGRYRFADFGSTPLRTHWLIEGLQDILIRGSGMSGCRVIGGQIGTVLRLEDCHRVRIEGFGIDLDPLPFTQGTLVEMDAHRFSIDWKLSDGHPTPLGFPFNLLGDPEIYTCNLVVKAHCETTGRILHHRSFPAIRVEQITPSIFRIFGKKSSGSECAEFPKDFTIGSPIVISSRPSPGAQPALWTSSTRHCTLRDIGVYASWQHAFQPTHDTSLKLIGCVCEPPPESDRLASTNADGIHVVSNRIGPYIKSCRIRRTNDDCSNLYSKAVSIDHQPASDRLILDATWCPDNRATNWQPDRRSFNVGDLLMLMDPRTGEIAAIPVIAATYPVQWRGIERIEVKLSKSVPTLITRESLAKRFPVVSNMEFFASEAHELIEHMAINLQTKCDGFVMRESILGENAVNGIKLKASNGLVCDNHFDRNAATGITCCMRLSWQEAFPPRNVRFEGNRFTATNGIETRVDYPGHRYHAGPPYLADLVIDRNTFVNPPDYAIQLYNLRDTDLAENVLDDAPVIEPSESVRVDDTSSRVLFDSTEVRIRIPDQS